MCLLAGLLMDYGNSLPATFCVQEAHASLWRKCADLNQQWLPDNKAREKLLKAHEKEYYPTVYKALRDAPNGFVEQLLSKYDLIEIAHRLRMPRPRREFRIRLRRHAREVIDHFLRFSRSFPTCAQAMSAPAPPQNPATDTPSSAVPVSSVQPSLTPTAHTALGVLSALNGHTVLDASNGELFDAYTVLHSPETSSQVVAGLAEKTKLNKRTLYRWRARTQTSRRTQATDHLIRQVIVLELFAILPSTSTP